MLKKSLRKLGPDFGFLAEEALKAEQNIMNRLDRSVKLDEVDTITFGLETDDGKIVKVYVKVDQADDFEKALSNKLGEIDDIEEVLNELSKEYEIIDVEWPSEDLPDDTEEDDGSDSLNQKVYNNPKEKAEEERTLKPKLEALTVGERLVISINEANNAGSLESRFTTASQLMIYHAMLELGIPEDALTRSAYRVEIIKNIKAKANELAGSPTMKSALKTFINNSIDYEEQASQNKDLMSSSKKDKSVKESLTEGVTQDFWNAFLELVNYIAATPKDAKELLANPTIKQIMTRSSASLSANVSAQLKTKLNDFKNSLAGDGSAAQLKAAGVTESYLRATEKLTEGASPNEIISLFKSLLSLADSSKDGSAAENALKSSAWNSFFNAAKGSLSQKFGGPVRAKLNQLKAVLPIATITENSEDYNKVDKMLDSLDTIPAGKDYVRSKDVGLKVAQNVPFKIPSIPDKIWKKKEIEKIDPSIVETYQSYIMKSKVKDIIKTGIKDDSVTIYRYKNKLYLADGNHRVAAAILTGKKTLNAKIFDIGNDLKLVKPSLVKENKSLKNATLIHSYKYGSENFDAGYPVEVIGEEGDNYIIKAFPFMANSPMKIKKSDIKLTGKINVPVGGNNGKMEGGLNESQIPEWSFDNDNENIVIQCATIKVLLNDEEVEKLIKGITNKDTVIVRDAEDQTHKVAFSPRGSSIMVKKVGTTDGVMMKQDDVNDLLDFISKGEDNKDDQEDDQLAGGNESAMPKEQEKT